MSKLRAPIKDLLDTSLDEAHVQRMWRRLQRGRQKTLRSWFVAGALAASVLAGVGLFVTPAHDAGPLVVRGATALTFAQPRSVLSDGSRIELATDTQLQVLENNGHSFVLRLERGRARFDVTPGGPRRWRMECGLASVTVVGTQLTIERGPSALRVEVAHGIVEVSGERVPGGLRRLSAGQAIYLERAEVQQQPRTAGNGSQPQPAATAAPTHEPAETQSAHTPKVAARTPPSAPTQLLVEADRARQSGARGRALAILRRLLLEQPGSTEAGIAAFTLARMQMEHDPRAAAKALRASLASATPESLREDALARLVEAYARSGDTRLASSTAAEYRQKYPDGRRLVEVERWAASP